MERVKALNITSPSVRATANDMERKPDQKTKRQKKCVCACFKKRWRAMKRSFSLSRNKVVPLHSDLEASDPSGLEPSAPQHQVDMQTGSSALEATGFQKPTNCQRCSSHLDETAPEDPAEHPPDSSNQQQTKKKKKKSSSPCFRKRWWALKRNNKVKTPPKQSDLNPSDHQPVPEGPANKQQTKEKKKRVFGGVWHAIKRVFSSSWNSEVVPFPTQSDLDPSDPQPGPFEQPYRRVFKPAVLQDPGDLGRGCCDGEQTPLEDPSGVQPAAPREPADSQRSRQLSFLYKMGKMIGEGTFGKVYEGTRRSDRLKVAIKFIQQTPRTNKYVKIPGHDKPLLREVALNLLIHKPEKCSNIVVMLDWFVEDGQHVLILEYPRPCVTLAAFMKKRIRLRENKARYLMRQAVTGAKHCIDHNICHGDLHSGNFLINTKTMALKLIDFGCGLLISSSSTPDSACKEPTEAVEQTVYFLGDLLLGMTVGDSGNSVLDPDALDKPAIKALGLSKEWRDMINLCMFTPSANMPTLEEILDHEWFKQS